MAECKKESCEGCPSASSCGQKPASMLAPANPASHIHKVVGIVSGKGGVGKSMVTASLANLMAAQGYKVGILDADYRSVHPQNVWSTWSGGNGWRLYQTGRDEEWNQDHVH